MIIEVYSGGMFTGKTSALISKLEECIKAKKNTIAFKPRIDTRQRGLKTHTGYEYRAKNVNDYFDIIEYLDAHKHAHVIGIDEVHMFESDGILELVDIMIRRNVDLYVAGLDLWHDGTPVHPTSIFLSLADNVYKLHTACVECGDQSYVSVRTLEDEQNVPPPKILIGGTSSYIPVCKNCFQKYKK